jgi:hypothetical protein
MQDTRARGARVAKVEQLRLDLARGVVEFERIDGALGSKDTTPDSWVLAAIVRDDAMRALRRAAPGDPVLAREDRKDLQVIGWLEKRLANEGATP